MESIYIFFKAIKPLLTRAITLRGVFLDIKVSRLRRILKLNIKGNTSISDADRFSGYLAICKFAAERDDIFNEFKGLSDYRRILEHATKAQGQMYLNIIKSEGRDLLPYFQKFSENDKIGNPRKYKYDVGEFSPTTLRYIKVLTDLKNIFGNVNNFDIAEIGVGYGGQCKIIMDSFIPATYIMIDLDVVLPLVRKYLTRFNIRNIQYLPPNQIGNDRAFDLVISNYAFSECTKNVQDAYINKILCRSKRGYLTCNYISTTVYRKEELCQILLKTHTSLKVIEERPLTTPPTMSPNYIIIWDDTKIPEVSNAYEKQ